ncbi:hypothetical protein NUBL21991_45410 [Klebsiella pneumoniae]|nr:hypothetical protein NUBL21991_45410 [Klebsiella pneumoniae]
MIIPASGTSIKIIAFLKLMFLSREKNMAIIKATKEERDPETKHKIIIKNVWRS